MPWVRLHGTKDYYGMALHLKEVPEFRCTINLVPSLLTQILAYTDKDGSDRHLDVSRLPADGLNQADGHFLLDNFFMANVDNMIRPFPRYHELYTKRAFGTQKVQQVLPRFTERDIRDLQVWNNLTWFHEFAFQQDSDLAEFRRKGHGWTEDEKQWLLEKQLDILRQIIPLHKELSDSGQVELTTTPFFHPILPLLWDKRSAREAMPDCPLPQHGESYREDAIEQIDRGVQFHTELFGKPPAGMWPSEGSVSQDIVEPVSASGIEWIATDEEILAHSTDGWVSRDGQGHLRNPEMLFRPWKVESSDHELQIVFRDHALSDLIGFHYQRSDPEHAAHDMLGRIEGIGRAVDPKNAGRPALVPVILDGENCWEYYPDGGVAFLRSLYQEAVKRPAIRPVRMIDHLTEFPATDRIGRLFAGSWISHNFAIWIGHDEDVRAWEALQETRNFLVERQRAGGIDVTTLKQAWEEIYIAEGSDWYWWFGDDHSSELDAEFDKLFRQHLKNVYKLLREPHPVELDQPIAHVEQRAIHTQPTSFLNANINGHRTFFEWINAGRFDAGSQRGTMTMVTRGAVTALLFGFTEKTMLLRIDTRHPAFQELLEYDELRVRFVHPERYEVRLKEDRNKQIVATLHKNGTTVVDAGLEHGVDQIVELAIPFAAMELQQGDPVSYFVELFRNKQSAERAPSEGEIQFKVPSRDFERIMWQA